jgi:hypothetical protein
MLASFAPHGRLQRGLTYAAFIVVGAFLLATRDKQRGGWVRLTTRLLPRATRGVTTPKQGGTGLSAGLSPACSC